MIETDWGQPLHLAISPAGDIKKFTTIEQAQHWLRDKWPVRDERRQKALSAIDAAIHCIGTIATARKAFVAAAQSAGFSPAQSRVN